MDQQNDQAIRRNTDAHASILHGRALGRRKDARFLEICDLVPREVVWPAHLVEQSKAASVSTVDAENRDGVHLARMIQLHDKVARLTGYARLPGISWATAACRRVVPERDCEAAIFKLGGQNGIGVDRDAAASQMMKSRKRVQ